MVLLFTCTDESLLHIDLQKYCLRHYAKLFVKVIPKHNSNN